IQNRARCPAAPRLANSPPTPEKPQSIAYDQSNDDGNCYRVQRFRYPFFMLFPAFMVFPAVLFFFFFAASPDFEKPAAAAHGHVGAAVRLLETGESSSFHGNEQFPMQSVYKLPIAMAVLHANLPLDRPVHI